MHMTPRNPAAGIYPATDYSHAMEVTGVARLLFISGTMGLDEKGRAADGLEQQLTLIWKNIGTVLADARMTVDNIVRLTSYLREAAFAEANMSARLKALNGRRIPTTAIVAATLEPGWLVEIEVIAAA